MGCGASSQSATNNPQADAKADVKAPATDNKSAPAADAPPSVQSSEAAGPSEEPPRDTTHEQLGPRSDLPGGVEDPSERPVQQDAPKPRVHKEGIMHEVDVDRMEQLPDATEAAHSAEAELRIVRTRLAMSESTVAEIEGRFRNTLDKDGDGGIDLPEFLQAMPEQLGQHSPELAKRLFTAFDHDESGKISVEELVAGLSAICAGDTKEKVRFVFGLYDKDNDGHVTRAELHALLRSYFGGKAAISAQAVECYDLEEVDFDAEEEAMGTKLGPDSQGKYDVMAQLDASVDDFVSQIFEGDTDQDGKLSRDEFEVWLERETSKPSAAGTATVKWVELLAGSLSSMMA